MRKLHFSTFFVAESIFISIVGGAVGLFMAEGLCMLVRNAGVPIAGLSSVGISFQLSVLNILIAALIGFINAIIPALGASRTSIIQTLRHAG